jgi:hypothetical protein
VEQLLLLRQKLESNGMKALLMLEEEQPRVLVMLNTAEELLVRAKALEEELQVMPETAALARYDMVLVVPPVQAAVEAAADHNLRLEQPLVVAA